MPKVKISEYSTTNTDNSDIEGINIAEGCAPSGINNAIRELMVHLKEFQTGSSGDPLTVAGTFASSGAAILSGSINSSATNTFSGSQVISGNINSSGSNTFSGAQVISGNINSSGSANTFSGGVVHSGTNTFSSSLIISGNINSSGTTNTFSGGNILSGTNTLSGTTVISGNATVSGTTNTISGAAIITGNINSSGTNTFSGSQIISGGITSSGTNTFSGTQVFSANSSSDAVRITQTGAGNALVVEDSANPDSTPFVVNSAGQVLVGTSSLLPGVTGGSISVLSEGDSAPNGNINGRRYSNDTTGLTFGLSKARGTFASPSIVQSGDYFGRCAFVGYDGANFITGVLIEAFVDGTPGTNDMPGRLVFSTTADGASSPTERMRIDSAGNVGIGKTAASGYRVDVGSSGDTLLRLTAAGQANGLELGQLTADGGNKVFAANNNYLAFGTNNTERMRINSAGNVGIGNTNLTQFNFRLSNAITGSTSSQAIRADGTVQSDVTTEAVYVNARPSTAAASFTLTDIRAFAVSQGTFGASSTVTNQYGYSVDSSLTGATNNYGFYGNIASGTGRWNLYMNGTAENYLGGNLKIGGTAARGTTAGTNHLSIFNGTAPAGTLTNGVTFYSDAGEAKVMDAAGNATLLSPHDPVTNEWIYYSVHTPTGKKLRIDMEKMMRFLNDHFDLDFVHEE